MSDLTEKENQLSECMSDTVSNECKTTEHKVSFVKPSKKSCPTRYLFVSKANTSLPIDILTQELIDIFSPFGPLDQSIPGTTSVGPVVINQKRHVCYVCFASKESCERALLATQAGQGLVLPSNNTVRLICKYADIERPVIPPPEPECISSTTEINVPGLTVIENFITSEEEQYLLDFCDNRNAEKFFSKDGKKERKKKGSFWENSISRRVQHFGYRFNYETRNLDAPRNMCPIPEFITEMVKSKLTNQQPLSSSTENVEQNKPEGCDNDDGVGKREENKLSDMIMTQMTINEYYPGQGIASHIDTADCFGPVIYILSLGCGLTMTMTDKGASIIDNENSEKETKAAIETRDDENENSQTKKHVWLPARSLMVLQGPARYQWAHGIAPRAMDKVNGELIRRKRRVSFTIREGIYTETEEDLAFAEMQRQVEALGSKSKGKATLKLSSEEEEKIMKSLHDETSSRGSGDGERDGALVASKVEEEHVFRVYDEIAQHWHHTRGKRKVYWQVVRNFLEGLPTGCLVADVGCGDGKYFGVGEKIVSIGCDRSPNLLQVSRDPNNASFVCDAVRVPFVSNKFDAAICIAVLHHLASVERRLAVISEIVRILCPGGRALIQAWALEQESTSKRQFNAQDVLVPWSLQQQFVRKKSSDTNDAGDESVESANVVFQRFCHVYKEGELESLINKIPNCRVVESGFDKSNWFIMIEKIVDK